MHGIGDALGRSVPTGFHPFAIDLLNEYRATYHATDGFGGMPGADLSAEPAWLAGESLAQA